MAAIISGNIFNDLNQNGIFTPGDPGIPNAYLSLLLPDGTCTQVQSDASGNYSFAGLTLPGTYKIYETVSVPNACPPTVFTQPSGMTNSTTPRVITVPITQAQIDAGTTIPNERFGHANVVAFGCSTEGVLVSGSGAATNLSTVDLMTGVSTTVGPLTPTGVYNAIGYSIVDNNLYGYDGTTKQVVRISNSGTATLFATIPNLPVGGYNVGDVDANGHLYLYETGTGTTPRFFVVDVNPNSATYLQLVDPATGFQLQTSNFGVPLTPPQNISDWAVSPTDGFLYGVDNVTSQVKKVNPVTGVVTTVATTGLPSLAVGDAFGSTYFDSAGNLYVMRNLNGRIFRVVITPSTATGTAFSTTTPAANSDGARCVLAAVDLLSVTKQVSASTAALGDRLTYTMTVTNNSAIPVNGIVLTDPIPSGTTFVPGSVTVGGSPAAGNPATGITIGTLAAGASTVVTFQVDIGNVTPTPNPIPNTATVSYTNGTPVDSNTVTTLVAVPEIAVVKSVSKTAAKLGDVLTYTMIVTNPSALPATGVVLTDPIPSGTAFVPGSVTVNGSPSADLPNTGINIGTLAAGASAVVTFLVAIGNTLPNPNPIPNTATVDFAEGNPTPSNTVTTLVFEPSRGVLFI